jgi:hypothetical protein
VGHELAAGTIDRDASKSNKGPRLSKLRAIELMIEKLDDHTVTHFYAAIEVEADVSVHGAGKASSETYGEEHKNYEGTLSFASDAVLNTLVAFVDTWITRNFPPTFSFGFYSSAAITGERASDRTKKLGITLPASPLLEALVNSQIDATVLNCVTKFVLDEYECQYAKRAGGYLADIKKWDEKSWRRFLKLITWRFGAEDDRALKRKVEKKIKSCSLFNPTVHTDREGHVVALLMELFDERQGVSIEVDRFVHKSDVKNVFHSVATGGVSPSDPTGEMWKELAAIDTRNLQDKIRAVCAQVLPTTVEDLARKVGASMHEQKAFEHDPRLRALKYQVWDECHAELAKGYLTDCDETTLRTRIEALVDRAVARIEERSKDFGYPLRSRPALEGIVLELVDSCFLSFDRRGV